MMILTSLLRSRSPPGGEGRAAELDLAHELALAPLFRDLPLADLRALRQAMVEVRLPAGTMVCVRGEPGERFYVIRQGSAEERLDSSAGGSLRRRLLPGDSFGESALLTGQPHDADVVVVEDAALWAMDRAHFIALAARSVPFLRALTRALSDRLARATQQLVALYGEGGADGAVAGLRFGPYRVVEQIAVGGMAAVYSAVHADTGAAAAIKVLPAAWGAAPELRARLAREAALLRRVRHPNVRQVLEVGEVAARLGGGCYLAMEWLPTALDAMLRAHLPEPLPVATALALARGVAEALAAVHAVGLVHRDVKPSNILLRPDGSPVLTDFGLAAALADLARGERLTPSNVVLGTADYMSPEQLAGDAVDGRSDLYSLGVVLYEMLTGGVPFAGRDPLHPPPAPETPPPLPATVPPAAAAVVAQALQWRPQDRFASAAAMAGALTAAL